MFFCARLLSQASKTTCIDELDIHLAKRRGMLAAIMHADAGLEKKRLNSVMLTAIDWVDECRQDALHKDSRKLVNENAAIFVGNLSSLKLTKTQQAQSVLDAGWGTLKTLLAYRCDHADVVFQAINEASTTQTCSCCGSRQNSPKGRAGLGIREWACECDITHDRDINAARNLLALGHERLAGGIPH